jgi:hypothetical protein
MSVSRKDILMQFRFPLRAFALLVFASLMVFGFTIASSGSAHAATSSATTVNQSFKTLAQLEPSFVGTSVYIWATDVNVRWKGGAICTYNPSTTNCVSVAQVSKLYVLDGCQATGQTITYDGITNNWWSDIYISSIGVEGWVNNVFIQEGHKIANVPNCFLGE